MSAPLELRLTPAQVSALECAGLELDEDEHEAIRRAWPWGTMDFNGVPRDLLCWDRVDTDALAADLVDLANHEDGQAEREPADEAGRLAARRARGARDALTNLAARVRRAAG